MKGKYLLQVLACGAMKWSLPGDDDKASEAASKASEATSSTRLPGTEASEIAGASSGEGLGTSTTTFAMSRTRRNAIKGTGRYVKNYRKAFETTAKP